MSRLCTAFLIQNLGREQQTFTAGHTLKPSLWYVTGCNVSNILKNSCHEDIFLLAFSHKNYPFQNTLAWESDTVLKCDVTKGTGA